MKSRAKWILPSMMALSLVATLPGMAQDTSPTGPAPSSGGWRRFQPNTPTDGPAAVDPGPAPQAQFPAPSQAPIGPTRLTIPAGTWVTIRVNEPLSSDHNQPGDAFTATLAQPVVVNGLVVARRGQLVSGRITEAKKAGRVSGVSRLGLEITEIGLADGNQTQVRTSMLERQGNTSYGRDAAAIGVTTATGAAIGAAVNGGVGAGVGAAAGVVASTVGVLLTRGRPTVVYPETPMTFRLEAPVTVEANYQAFQPASQQDYGQGITRGPAPRPGYGAPPPYGYYAPYPYPYPYAYGYPYWGPSFYFGYRGGFRRW